MISKRLFYHKSIIIKGELSVTFTAGSSTTALPDNFWGLIGKPYVNGDTVELQPIPNNKEKLFHTTAAQPRYYELAFSSTGGAYSGPQMKLYPGASTETTVNGMYWSRPAKVSKPSDAVPFNEMFDDVIQEAVIHIYQTGLSSGNPSDLGLLKEYINTSVDEIVPYIELSAPVRFEDSMNLDYFTEVFDD
jgi:hypothetical protein